MDNLTPAQRTRALHRFEEKLIPEPNSGCWLWTGAGNPYGKINIGGRQVSTHRLAWVLHRGKIPEGQHVCHKCDVPCCVNPHHLFLGTPADNHADKAKKGRGRGSKLTPEEITFAGHVRALRKQGKSFAAIARMYGVSRQAIHQRFRHTTARMAAAAKGHRLPTFRSLANR